jgi:hypothetical protein
LLKNPYGEPNTFHELFNYVDMDLDNPKGDYVMEINNAPAGFNDELKEGDDCILKWKD